MALPWIKVHSNLRRHPKVLALSDAVEQDHAWCYLVALWSWASEFCPTGVIAVRGVPRLVERESGWAGDHGKLFDAMVQTGWLIASDDGMVIAGWEEYQLPHINHAKREAARQKALREKEKLKKLLPDANHSEYELTDGTQDRTRTEARTVARPDRDREIEKDTSSDLTTDLDRSPNLALFEIRKGAGEEEKPKPRRGRPPKDRSPEAESERLAERADADRWLEAARKLTGAGDDVLRWSGQVFMAFRRARKARGIDQLLRALEGLENDSFSRTAGLGWLISEAGITKGLLKAAAPARTGSLDLSKMDYSTWDEI